MSKKRSPIWQFFTTTGDKQQYGKCHTCNVNVPRVDHRQNRLQQRIWLAILKLNILGSTRSTMISRQLLVKHRKKQVKRLNRNVQRHRPTALAQDNSH